MRQNKIKAALICAVLLLASAVTGAAQQKSEMNRAAGKFNQTLFYIDRLYLEDVDLKRRPSWRQSGNSTRILPISRRRMSRL